MEMTISQFVKYIRTKSCDFRDMVLEEMTTEETEKHWPGGEDGFKADAADWLEWMNDFLGEAADG